MKCQFCQLNQGNVHVTEVEQWHGPGSDKNKIVVKHLCEACAANQDLPIMAAGSQASAKLWNLMQVSAKVEVKTKVLTCGSCGLTQLELRKKGRVGCPTCYQTFASDLENMLDRIHGSTEHVGRGPENADSYERGRQDQIGDLKNRLDQAVAQEKFEVAAELRDQLADLEETES